MRVYFCENVFRAEMELIELPKAGAPKFKKKKKNVV